MRAAVLAFMTLALPAALAGAAEINAALIVAPEADSANGASPYATTPQPLPLRGSRQDLELRLRQGGLNAQATLRWQAAEGASLQRHGIANQLYYDGELGEGLGWTAGKKVLSWGVGFGFRPLDLVQRENRRGVNLPALEGVPLLALERFAGGDAWTLAFTPAWTRPGASRDEADNRGQALALHWYRLTAGGDDLHAVARLSRDRGLEAGAGFTRVVGEEWSFYGAALWERRYAKTLNALAENGGLLAAADPMAPFGRHGGRRAVLGAQWTGASGWSLLAEGWLDDEAYRIEEWRRLDALTARQWALLGLAPAAAVNANVAASGQAYLAANLLRENLLLRLAYDDGDGFRPYAEVLATPADGGKLYTLGAVRESDRHRLAFGLRQTGGAEQSVLARAPLRRMAWVEWRWALF